MRTSPRLLVLTVVLLIFWLPLSLLANGSCSPSTRGKVKKIAGSRSEEYQRLARWHFRHWHSNVGPHKLTPQLLDFFTRAMAGFALRVRVIGSRVFYLHVQDFNSSFMEERIPCYLEAIHAAARLHSIPPVDFFVSCSDKPHARLDSLGGYYVGYPLFSLQTGPGFIDVPVPDVYEYGCVNGYRQDLNTSDDTPWSSKLPLGVWRGATTNMWLFHHNWDVAPRVKLARWGKLRPDLLNAGITRLSHVRNGTEFFREANLSLVGPLSWKQHLQYKYLIDIDGGVGSSRTTKILSSSSVMLWVKSIWQQHVDYLLEEYEHYVPVQADLEDLADQVLFCRKNDDLMRRIVRNANAFAKQHLGFDAVVLYWATVLKEYHTILQNPPGTPTESEICRTGQRVCGLSWIEYKGSNKSI